MTLFKSDLNENNEFVPEFRSKFSFPEQKENLPQYSDQKLRRRTDNITIKSNINSLMESKNFSRGYSSMSPRLTEPLTPKFLSKNTNAKPAENNHSSTNKKLVLIIIFSLMALYLSFNLLKSDIPWKQSETVFSPSQNLLSEILDKLNTFEEVSYFETQQKVEKLFGFENTEEILEKLDKTIKQMIKGIEEFSTYRGKVWKKSN